MAVTNSNVKFNACFDGANGATSFTEKATGATVTRVGTAALSTTSPLYPPSSGTVPDLSSWWTAPIGGAGALGAGDYTVEVWFQTTGDAGALINSSDGDIWIGQEPNRASAYIGETYITASTFPLSVILNDGNLHVISVQRKDGNIDIWVDEVRLFYGQVTGSVENVASAATTLGFGHDIGPGGTDGTIGKIGGVRITAGQALYSSTENYRTFPSPYDLVGASSASVVGAQTLAPVSQVATNKAYVLIPGGTSTGTYSVLAFSDAFDSIAPPTLQQTLAGVTQTAVAKAIAGLSGAQTLAGVTQTGALVVTAATISATGAQTLDPVSQTATLAGVPVVALTGAQTLASVTQAATLSAPAAITGAQTLGDVTQAGTLTSTLKLAGAQVLADATQAATLTSLTHLQGAQTLDTVTQVATGTVTAAPGVTGSQVLAGVTQTATLTTLTHATGAQTLGPVTQSASAIVLPVLHTTGAQILENVAQAATAQLLAKMSGAQTLDPVTQVATAGQQIGFHGAQVLGGVVQLGTLSVFDTVFHYTGAQVLAGVHQLARIQHEYIFEENVRTRHIGGEDRGYGIIAQERGTVTGPEDRGYGIDPQDRGYVSTPQERTHTITP